MADIKIEDLIHAGLPWTNPLKITVKSDEYINLMVINRGFLNLLSNDYYLDLKAERINQYIEGVLKNHIDDKDIHFTLDDVLDLIKKLFDPETGDDLFNNFKNYLGLFTNTTYILPVYADSNLTYTYIKQILQNCPRNLNGHTLILAFTIPLSRINSSLRNKKAINMTQANLKDSTNYRTPKDDNNTYVLDLEYKNISFDSFYGGTIMIVGNDQFYYNDLNNDGTVNYDLMFNPISKKDTRLLFEHIQKELVKTEIKKSIFQIEGNGLNNKLSVLSIRDCHADVFLYNLLIKNNKTPSQPAPAENLMPYITLLAIYYPMNITENTNVIYPQLFNDLTFNNLTSKDLILTCDNSLSTCFSGNIYYTNLNNNYLLFDGDSEDKKISNTIRRLMYGKYKQGDEVVYDTTSGCSIMFWMNNNFGGKKDIKEVPIIYDYNGTDNLPIENGFYLGLERIAIFEKDRGETPIQYVDTSFTTTIKNVHDNKWILWYILITREKANNAPPETANLQFTIKYKIKGSSSSSDWSTLKGKTTISYPISNINLNTDKNIKLFGYKNFSTGKNQVYDHNIRNLMFFNNPLTKTELNQIYNSGSIIEYYNWADLIIDVAMINNSAIYSSVYVYNTDMLNIINCYLIED